MLTKLSIKNYALIESLSVNFHDGFTTITGETGAGKSILLGALGLVLGKRADTTFLKDKNKKCIVEVEFEIGTYHLKTFFNDNDLDYESLTIVRREILPSGKSRAFINDTPVTLTILNSLSENLIDIHSQHQTLELSETKFQFKIIDTLASNFDLLNLYKEQLIKYNQSKKELEELLNSQNVFKQHYDYNLHLFQELESANLSKGEQEEIENKIELMNNVEMIKSNLEESIEISHNDDFGLFNLFNSIKTKIREISTFSDSFDDLYQRIESVDIEIKDIVQEFETINENVEFSKEELEKLSTRLQLIYDLLKKHSALSITELIDIKSDLSKKVAFVQNSSEKIAIKRSQVENKKKMLEETALKIHTNRKKIIPKFVHELEQKINNLGMSNSRFKLEIKKTTTFLSNGMDEIKLYYSANKGENFGELKKIASGGELSRIMLSVKSILASHIKLPTIIFDEIDTGVSGEISNKMADIMHQMSNYMQVLSITHLPQVAAKGQHHYKVYKEDTLTQLKLLNTNERINEIAEIIGGKQLSSSALAHAKELLN